MNSHELSIDCLLVSGPVYCGCIDCGLVCAPGHWDVSIDDWCVDQFIAGVSIVD